MKHTEDEQMNSRGKKRGGEGNERGVGGAYKRAWLYFQLQFTIFHGHVSPASFSKIIGCRVFASLAAFHFRGFVFEKVAIIAKWFLCFSKHGEALGRAPVSGPGS